MYDNELDFLADKKEEKQIKEVKVKQQEESDATILSMMDIFDDIKSNFKDIEILVRRGKASTEKRDKMLRKLEIAFNTVLEAKKELF